MTFATRAMINTFKEVDLQFNFTPNRCNCS